MKKLILLLSFILLSFYSKAQERTFQSSTHFVSEKLQWIDGQCVIPLDDSGFVVAGYASHGGKDTAFAIARFDKCQQFIWGKKIHINGVWIHSQFIRLPIAYNQDGFYFGLTARDPQSDFILHSLLLRFNQEGELLWTKQLNYADNRRLVTNSIIATRDGGCIVGSVYLISVRLDSLVNVVSKVDRNGKTLWSESLYSYGEKMYLAESISGETIGIRDIKKSFNPNFFALDKSGKLIWSKLLLDTTGFISYFNPSNFTLDQGGNIYTIGWLQKQDTTPRTPFVLKMDNNAGPVWLHYYDIYPTSPSRTNILFNYSPIFKNNKLYIFGIWPYDLSTNNISPSAHLLRLSPDGEMSLSRKYPGLLQAYLGNVAPTAENTFIGGYNLNNIVQFTSEGKFACTQKDTSLEPKSHTVNVSNYPLGIFAGGSFSDTTLKVYSVKLKIRVKCSSPFIPIADLGEDTLVCSDELKLSLDPENSICSIYWNTGDTTLSITTKKSGDYWVQLKYGNCISRDTVHITFIKDIEGHADKKRYVCPGDSMLFTAVDTAGRNVYWLTPKKDPAGKPIRKKGSQAWARDTGYYYLMLDMPADCKALDSLHLGYNPIPKAIAGPDTLLCYNQVYTMQGKGGITYKWIPAKYLSSDTLPDATAQLTVSQKYILVVKNSFGCSDTSEVTLKVRTPLQVQALASDTLLCNGTAVTLSAKAYGGYAGHYTYYWPAEQFMDRVVHAKLTASGWHKVVINDECSPPAADSIYIRVLSPPKASFQVLPSNEVQAAEELKFQNTSTGAVRYKWVFGNRADSSEKESPRYTFYDSGAYVVRLTAYNELGCWDTASGLVYVKGRFQVFVPNTFSPNGDNLNESFGITGTCIANYKLEIFNRWGERVFLSSEKEKSWDGTWNNHGQEVSEGVYIYVLEVKDIYHKSHYLQGTLTLLR